MFAVEAKELHQCEPLVHKQLTSFADRYEVRGLAKVDAIRMYLYVDDPPYQSCHQVTLSARDDASALQVSSLSQQCLARTG